MRLAIAFLLALFAPAAALAATPALLPSGYLSTAGNQIVSASGTPVRLACVGIFDWASEGTTTIAGDFQGITAAGFNCVRYPWYDATLTNDLSIVDQMVTAANTYGIKIILDHHGNEATVNSNGTDNGPAYPCNGMWYDVGGTNPVAGCPTTANFTNQQVLNNWQTVAEHYAGNTTVIGFDLQNEPHLNPSYFSSTAGGSTWGTSTSGNGNVSAGGATDILQFYSQAAALIQAADPGVLIICEGVGNSTGKLFNGATPVGGSGWDLSLAASQPVSLTVPNKLVYSAHRYPVPIGDSSPDSGSGLVASLNQLWGFLVTSGQYPFFLGELGGSLDGTNESAGTANGASVTNLADEQAWASTMVAYLNGQDGASGGPTFSGTQQPISTDWWAWGYLHGEQPDGTLTSASQTSLNTAQQAIYSQLQFVPVVPITVAYHGMWFPKRPH